MTLKQRTLLRRTLAKLRLRTWIAMGIIAFLAPIALFALLNPNRTEATWFDETFLYRQKITIGNTGSADTSKRVKFDVDTAALVTAGTIQTDCDDVRFTDINGKSLKFYFDSGTGACNTNSSDFWVLVETINTGNTILYMYYGNASAVNASNTAQFAEAQFSPTSGPTFASQEASVGPMSYWRFNEGVDNTCSGGTNDVCDGIPTQSDLSRSGAAWQSEDLCLTGKCFLFDGTDDFLTRTDDSDLDFVAADTFTISAWFRHGEQTSGTDVLLAKYNAATSTDGGYKVYMESDGDISFGIDDDQTSFPEDTASTTAATYDDNQWHHIAAVKNGTTSISIYIDGVLIATDSSLSASGTLANTDAFYIGIDGDGTSNPFQGFIDDVKIYRYVRSAAQIKTDFLGKGLTKGASTQLGTIDAAYLNNGLVGYWKLDETSSTAADSSGNALTLTNNGTTTYVTAKYANGSEHVPASSQYLSTATTISGVKTVSFWVNPDSTTNNFIHLATGVYINASSGTIATTGITNATIYVNGRVSSTLVQDVWQMVTVSTDTAISASAFEIGRANGSYFDGTMDDVRVYNRTLSAIEVGNLSYWAPSPNAHWKIDENTNAMPRTATTGGGMLVYGDSTTTDAMEYRIMDNTGTWTAAAAAFPDVDTTTTNKIAQTVRVYSSSVTNEKMVLSGNDDGTTYTVYGTVWNGSTQTWNTPTALGSNTENSLDMIRFFDGAYLSDGRFLAIYYDNTDTPKAKFWSGTAWGSEVSTQDVSTTAGDALEIHQVVVKARPGTTEAMIALRVDDSTGSTNRETATLYYDGAGEASSDFTATTHTGDGLFAESGSYPDMDFEWSENNPLRGALVYQNSATDFTPVVNIFTADGAGSGSWGTLNEGVGIDDEPVAARIVDRPGANEFLFCVEDDDNDAGETTEVEIECLKEADNDTSPTVATTTNGVIAAASAALNLGFTYSYDLEYEQVGGATAIAVYSDGTTSGIPNLKKYDAATSTWDAAATTLSDMGTSDIRTVEVIADPNSNDMAIIMRDGVFDMWLAFWDGTNNAVYASGDRTMAEYSTDSGATTRSSSADFAYDLYDNTPTPTIYDSVGNSSVATTGVTFSQGKYGSGGVFNGSDFAQITDSASYDFSASENFSIQAWAKHDGTISAADYLISKADSTTGGYKLYMDASGDFCFAIDDDATWTPDDSACTSGVDYDDGNWHHVVGVKNATSSILLYVDGILVASDTSIAATSTIANAGDLYFGADSDETGGWDGNLDDIKIYRYARSQSQVVEDLNAIHPFSGSPVSSHALYWNFDEGQGTTANSKSSVVTPSTAGTLTSIATPATTSSGWTASGKVNKAVIFDGSDDKVVLATANDGPVDFNGSEQFSASAWIYVSTMPTSTASDKDAIIAKWDDTSNQAAYRLYVENDDTDATGNIEVQVYDESASQALTATGTTDQISQNTWYHVAFSFNGGTAGTAGDLKLYIDGQSSAQNSANGSFAGIEDLASDFTVGDYDATDGTAGNTAFTGTIDEVKVYSGVLSVENVLVDMNIGGSNSISTTTKESSIGVDSETAPVGYWPMDENTGTTSTFDYSGADHTGTLNGTMTSTDWVPGKFGSALDFDGSDDYVAVTDPADGSLDFASGDFTVSAWFKKTNASSQRFVSKKQTNTADVGYALGDNATNLYFNIADGVNSDNPTVSATAYRDGKWHNIVGVVERGVGVTLYVDGIVANQDTAIATGSVSTADDLNFARVSGGGSSFAGQLDDIKIYNYARKQSQIAYEYSRGLPLAWYKFDECSGPSAYDAANNTYTGTITPTTLGNTVVGDCVSGTSTHMWYNGATGKYNSSLDFDGSDDYVEIADAAALRFDANILDYSIFAWVKRATTGTMYIISKEDADNDGWRLMFDSSNLLVCSQDSSDATSTTAITDTNWHFVGCTVDRNGNAQTYIDGLANGTATALAADAMATTSAVRIGTRSYTSTSYFDGQIDDVRIFNYVLSSTQIKKIMNNDSAVRYGPETGSP